MLLRLRTISQRLSEHARTAPTPSRCLNTAAGLRPTSPPKAVKLVEVGPRDGLQNEKALLPTALKVELIERLVRAGMRDVEAGSFVSPKWSSATFTSPANPRLTGEIAVFVSATESFSRANLNCSVADSLKALEPVFRTARDKDLRVRAYVSVVIGCPFEGTVEPGRPADVAKQLLEMGAYEVSLGDTVGVGVPMQWEGLLEDCEKKGVGVEKLALGIHTVDSSIAALGGCPYSPGATGNVSTEDVLYAFR
ncbi:hypothetical protein JCM10213v2_002810 [Rhodosporidiobolus nylandii]